MRKIVLASASLRRKEILTMLGLSFIVQPSNYDEESAPKLAPRDLAKHLALQKARAVASKRKNALVLGFDTVIVVGNRVFGKQRTPAEVRSTLRLMSGKKQKAITGIAVIDSSSGKTVVRDAETELVFRNLTRKEIESYVRSREWEGNAGGYSLVGRGGTFAKSIHGNYLNVIGLPVPELLEVLKKFGAWPQ